MIDLLAQSGWSPEHWSVVTFLTYTGIVLLLAVASHQVLKGKSFLKEYFLGSRSLGVWALALTYAATSASGGSFTGFPALIYKHGWILALWIAGYMIVPAVCLGLLGKRLNQVSRKTGAITLPDILRDRFASPRIGILISLLLTFFLGFNLVAQFKAGGLIVEELFSGVEVFASIASYFDWIPSTFSFLGTSSQPSSLYSFALLLFAFAVVVYTAYGGFRAVVWTDVLQGVVMFIGVLILLPLVISKAGGLKNATEQLAKVQFAEVEVVVKAGGTLEELKRGTVIQGGEGESQYVFVLEDNVLLNTKEPTRLLIRRTAGPQLSEDQAAFPESGAGLQFAEPTIASALTLQSFRFTPEVNLVNGPGPKSGSPMGFLPIGIALSFFIMWPITGAGQPGTLVRLMAFKSSNAYRKAIFTATVYYSFIYIPLVIIFVCARVILPDIDQADKAMPQIIKAVVTPAIAGILLAAPFAAVMSTVDSFLLMISSSLVRDIYQRGINPQASPQRIKKLTYITTMTVGVLVTIAAFSPPDFLQVLIVFSSEGLACCFLAPMVLSLYWKKSTIYGVYAAILSGFFTVVCLYGVNWITQGSMSPYLFLGVMPVVWGLAVSFIAGIVASLLGPQPDQRLVSYYFHKDALKDYPGELKV